MTKFFLMGGPTWMSILTILLVITTTWIIYHFISSYHPQADHAKLLRGIEYGKSMGLFTMVSGFLAQMIGLINMFSVIKDHPDIESHMIYDAIYVTMISAMYGVIIYLFTLLLWFITRLIIEKKFNNQ